MIDEQFDTMDFEIEIDAEAEDFWQSALNMFI